MFEWDDARIFIEAARAGGLGKAALRLGIDAATVGRRVSRLETALKATLVIRSVNGLRLTAAGEQFLEALGSADRTMAAAAEAVRPDFLTGVIRLSASEGFGTTILAPALPDLARKGQGVRVELTANSGFLSPSRREVDVAVTLSQPHAANLVVEPLTDYQLALYASPGYLAEVAAPDSVADLIQHRIVGYIEDQIYAPELRYLEEILPGLKPHLASSSIRAQREIIASGGGIGVLPCFLAQDLVRVLPGTVLHRRFWLSAHRSLQDTVRLRVLQKWIAELCQAEAARLNPFPA